MKPLWTDADDEDLARARGKPVSLKERVWQDFNLLVMDKHASLPPLCVKTGSPATHWVKRELCYHPPAVYLYLLLGVLPYLANRNNFTSLAVIEVGLCEEWYQRQRTRLAFGWALGITGGLIVAGSIIFGVTMGEHEFATVIIVLGFAVMLIGLAVGIAGGWLLSCRKLDSDYLWIEGVHPDVLATLPQWPNN